MQVRRTHSRAPAEGIYRRVSVRMYGDDRFCKLSPMPPSGQTLWIYLLTGPHTGPIPGVFVAGKAALAEALGWGAEAFEEAFQQVIAQGLCTFDSRTRMWFIDNALRHNMPANPNVVLSWRAPLSLLPECELREAAIEHMREVLFTLSEAFGKAFEEACGKPSEKTKPTPSAKASRKDMAKQEQETGSRKQEEVPPTPKGNAALFSRFWEAYPRKESKVQALKAFDRIGVDEKLLLQMLASVDAHARSEGWRKDSGKFIPYASTWLNGRRWEDEMSHSQGTVHVESKPQWALAAGFGNRFEAESAGCFERNAKHFRNGKRLETA